MIDKYDKCQGVEDDEDEDCPNNFSSPRFSKQFDE